MITSTLARVRVFQDRIQTPPSSPVILGTCHHYQRYCGSWLIEHDGASLQNHSSYYINIAFLTCIAGYTKSDLAEAIERYGAGKDVQDDPENVLFECATIKGGIDMIEHCYNGCIETGGQGHNDACASKFNGSGYYSRLLMTLYQTIERLNTEQK